MSLLLNESITVKREGAGGGYVNGHYIPGSDTEILAKANIQPLGGSELLELPESDRLREPLRFYTNYELNENDIVVRALDSKQYEIKKKGNWAVFGRLQHYKAVGLLVDAQ